MAAKDKDTIYVDIDDEITGIIDKVRSSDGKVTALVLPKRAAAFQSIVNMKLLKRAADAEKKNLVLITTEAGLLPLAGAAGIHVAKTLTSKPEIPSAPALEEEEDEPIQEVPGEEDPELDSSAPIGQLAAAKPADDGVETVVLDDEDLPPELDEKPKGPKKFVPPKGKKKLSVPNFEKFRLLLVAGVLAVILLFSGLIYAFTAMPKATISIKTNAQAIDTNVGLNLSTTAKDLDVDEGTIPAKLAQQQKTYTQQVPTTGQKNNGNKASGSVVVTNCSKNDDAANIPAGTGFSSGGNTYISQEAVVVPPSDFTGGGNCKNNGKASVQVIAQNGGSSYNKPAGASFSVAIGGSLSAQGNTISGGTDSIVQTVNQNDINNAKAKIATNDNEMKKTLKDQLKKESKYAIEATFSAGTPNTTSSAAVGAVADNVTVTETITYTMFGVNEGDLSDMIEDSVKDQIDTSKQSIIDNGLGQANFNVSSLTATGGEVTVATVATAGPDLDTESIRQAAAGKKSGPIEDELKRNPGVTDVEIKLSPFWVSSVPKKTDKIKVEIAKPDKAASSSSSE